MGIATSLRALSLYKSQMVLITIKIFFPILLFIRSELARGVKDEVGLGKKEGEGIG